MASYPASVKSFTTKNAGDTIQPAHVNDIQDEVNAIESGLLNGTARLNAAGSTLTSLSVTGNSTLAALQGGASTLTSLQSGASTVASLSVSGASTFAARPTMPPPDALRAFPESIYDMGSSGQSTIALTGEFFNTNSSMHSTGTNPERVTPQSTGVYLFTGQIGLAGPVSAASSVALVLRDSSNTVIGRIDHVVPNGVSAVLNATAVKRFDALGGWMVLSVSNNGGGSTLSFSTATSWFSMVKV